VRAKVKTVEKLRYSPQLPQMGVFGVGKIGFWGLKCDKFATLTTWS
jgi:hypothetical protein